MGGLGEQEGGAGVDGEEAVPVLDAVADERPWPVDAGVADQPVQPAEPIGRLPDDAGRIVGGAHVAVERQRVRAKLAQLAEQAVQRWPMAPGPRLPPGRSRPGCWPPAPGAGRSPARSRSPLRSPARASGLTSVSWGMVAPGDLTPGRALLLSPPVSARRAAVRARRERLEPGRRRAGIHRQRDPGDPAGRVAHQERGGLATSQGVPSTWSSVPIRRASRSSGVIPREATIGV